MISLLRNVSYGAIAWRKAININSTFVRSIYQNNIWRGVSRCGFDDYAKERASWIVKAPEKFNFASDVVDVWAQKERDGLRSTTLPAFWFVYDDGTEIKWSYQDLERESKRTANALLNCGVCKGDDVMVVLPKIPEFWLISIAAMRIGCVVCPGTTQLTAKDMNYRVQAFKPSCFIAHESVIPQVLTATQSSDHVKLKIQVSNKESKKTENATKLQPLEFLEFQDLLDKADANHECVKSDNDDSMTVFFTSGSTGNPKMVEHSYLSFGIFHESTGKYFLDLTSESILWSTTDPGWSKTAFGSIFLPWARGCCLFMHQMPRFNPKQCLEILSKYPIDTLCAAPMAYRAMVHEDLKSYKFNKLAHCVTGGEALNPEVYKIWHDATGLPIYEGYGLTESITLISMYRCLKYKAGSMGKSAVGADAVILDDNENEVGPGVEGEIALKRTSERIFGLFKEYRGEPPEVTKKRLESKYYRTGDLAYYDEEGYFFYVGRKDDVINSSGYRIGPCEVENALMEHPAVLEVAVVSSPDEERGEVVKAFVAVKQEYRDKIKVKEAEAELIKELQEHTKRITAPYKYPRKIEFVTQLPKTLTLKIKRSELKQKEWERAKKAK